MGYKTFTLCPVICLAFVANPALVMPTWVKNPNLGALLLPREFKMAPPGPLPGRSTPGQSILQLPQTRSEFILLLVLLALLSCSAGLGAFCSSLSQIDRKGWGMRFKLFQFDPSTSDMLGMVVVVVAAYDASSASVVCLLCW